MGGVTAWGIYANAKICPPVFDNYGADGEIDPDDEWEPSEDEEEGILSPRQVAQTQLPRPPTSLSDYSFVPESQRGGRGGAYPTISLNLQGKLPAHTSQTSFQPYPGSSQQLPTTQQSAFSNPVHFL
jgi:hypothetical protein